MGSFEVGRIPGEATLADAHAVRRAVFVDGQGVPESVEIDGRDGEAVHFVISDGETPVATARLRLPEPGVAKPERVAVRPEYRGEGLGKRLMALLESEARTQGCSRAVLHAQTRVVGFYERLGYRVTSDQFEEAGIPHVEMEKEL